MDQRGPNHQLYISVDLIDCNLSNYFHNVLRRSVFLVTSNLNHSCIVTLILPFGLRGVTGRNLVLFHSFGREEDTNGLISLIPSLRLPLGQVYNKVQLSA